MTNTLANLPRFEGRGAPFPFWFYRIAANAIVDRAKRASRESAELTPEPAGEPDDRAIEQAEQRVRRFRLVRELPDDQRLVLIQRFAEEKSIREIAAALSQRRAIQLSDRAPALLKRRP